MRRASHILSLCLAALIALTAQGASIARAMPDASGQMIICTGDGPIMMYFDAEGEPTAPPHLCADFAMGLVVALGAVDALLLSDGVWTLHAALVLKERGPLLALGARKARGPPVLMSL